MIFELYLQLNSILMKKHFHSLIILCAVIITNSAMSQSLQISYNSGTIPNGTIFHVWGDTLTGTLMSIGIDVKNISSGTVTIKSKKIENSLIPETSCNMCFAGQCFLSTVFISTTSSTLVPNTLDTTFSGDYWPKGHLGESIITFVFFNVDNEDDSAWVVVHFNGTPAGISENTLSKINISNPYPNPAINYTSFKYGFPENTVHAQFVLRDILGFPVKEIEINNPEGKLLVNTTDIKSGIYFYSFYVDDKLILTKKLIVR